MPRDPYDPNLFAGRANDLDQIHDWLMNPSDQRLRSITGSPGSGKTWLLERVRQDYDNDPQFLVLHASAPALADPSKRLGELQRLVASAAMSCGPDPSPLRDPTLHPEQLMRGLGRWVCERCGDRIPLLILDGLDELSDPNDRGQVEDLLWAFLEGGACARALIARRDEWGLDRFQLRHIEVQHPLSGLNLNEAEDQFRRRLRHRHGRRPASAFNTFRMAHIPEYDGSHPSMNAFLTDWIARSPSSPPALSDRDLEACIQDAVGGPLSPEAMVLLQTLCCRDEWAQIDLQDCRITPDNPAVNELFMKGILVEVPPRYKVADGFRGMARAWRRLCGSPCP